MIRLSAAIVLRMSSRIICAISYDYSWWGTLVYDDLEEYIDKMQTNDVSEKYALILYYFAMD